MSDEWATITPNKGEPKEKVEFEIEGQEEDNEQLQLELDTDNQEEDKEPAKKVKAKEETAESEEQEALEGVETSGAQKRIRQLVQQKKEREAEIERLLQENKNMQLSLQQQQEEYRTAVGQSLENSDKAVQEKLVIAKDSYRRALDTGDTDLIVQAQEYLNNAQIDVLRLEEAKKQYASLTPRQRQELEQQAQPQQQQQQQLTDGETYNGYTMKAYQWASANEWFNSDVVMTNAALIIDQQLKDEGYDPNSDEFYEEVDSRMAQNFPHKFSQPVEQEAENPRPKATSSPSQVVAGASLSPKASSGKKVKLTQEDVRLAQKWGISLEQYAAEKLKIESAEEGAYTTIR
jgi:hypothetical protein